jgi:hypothetical protein
MRVTSDKYAQVESSIDIVKDSVGIVIGDRDETGKNTLKMYIPRFMAGITLETTSGVPTEEEVSFSEDKIINSVNKDIGSASVTTQNYLEIPCFLVPGISMPRFVVGQELLVTFADGDIKSPIVYPFTVQDQGKKATDILQIGVPARPEGGTPIANSGSYFMEFNSRDQYVRLYTSVENEENNPFNFLVNTKEGIFKIADDTERVFEWIYNDDTFHWHTDAGLDILLKENEATIACETLNINAESEINIETSTLNITADEGAFAIDKLSIEGTKLEIKETDTIIDSSSTIVLKTVGTANWHPNMLPACPFGAPHGGQSGGITGLKGS